MQNTKIHRFVKAHKFSVVGFSLSLIAAVTLTFTHLKDAIYFEDTNHQNVELRSWMTPRYIALSYNLPRPIVLEILEIDEDSDFPKRLDLLAERLGISLVELTVIVRDKATEYRGANND